MGRNNGSWRPVALALATFLLMTGNAAAYVGPMPGPEFLGYFAALLGWMAVIFGSVLFWPIQVLLRCWRKPATPGPAAGAALEEHPQ
jgi:hypothetical protein